MDANCLRLKFDDFKIFYGLNSATINGLKSVIVAIVEYEFFLLWKIAILFNELMTRDPKQTEP